MAERTSYVEGTPNWVELRSPDPAAATEFYRDLFGWTCVDEATDSLPYFVARLGGGRDVGAVAAITGLLPPLQSAVSPPCWVTYLAVDDVEDAVSRVEPLGGRIAVGPSPVGAAGRAAIVADPTGASVGLWQAERRIGATLVNEPGALIWNELMTDDLPSAARFYEGLVGLTAETAEMKGGPYTTFQARGQSVAGATGRSGDSNYWHVYFAVADAAASCEAVVGLGGKVVAGPLDTAIGPMAMLCDRQGAVFSVFQLNEP